MVQGTKQLKKKSGKEKTDKRNRKKAAEPKARVGLTKVAKKPGVGKTRRGTVGTGKMNRKLTGAITSHIEDIMIARINEERGQTASSSLKVLKGSADDKAKQSTNEKKPKRW